MTKILLRRDAYYSIIILFSLPLIISEVSLAESEPIPDQKDRIQALCDMDPMSSKCKKFLDSKYRRHVDAEKSKEEGGDVLETHADEKTYRGELKRELLSFCRKEPDSYRCQKKK